MCGAAVLLLLAAAAAAGPGPGGGGGGEEAIQCPPCSEERLARCKTPQGCAELVREPGCGCCATCALGRGTACGVYTARCGAGLRCYPPRGVPRPLHTLMHGQGVCTDLADVEAIQESLQPPGRAGGGMELAGICAARGRLGRAEWGAWRGLQLDGQPEGAWSRAGLHGFSWVASVPSSPAPGMAVLPWVQEEHLPTAPTRLQRGSVTGSHLCILAQLWGRAGSDCAELTEQLLLCTGDAGAPLPGMLLARLGGNSKEAAGHLLPSQTGQRGAMATALHAGGAVGAGEPWGCSSAAAGSALLPHVPIIRVGGGPLPGFLCSVTWGSQDRGCPISLLCPITRAKGPL